MKHKMTKKELLEELKGMPDNTEILIGDARGDKYGIVHYASKYDINKFNDHCGYFDDKTPPVFMIKTKM